MKITEKMKIAVHGNPGKWGWSAEKCVVVGKNPYGTQGGSRGKWVDGEDITGWIAGNPIWFDLLVSMLQRQIKVLNSNLNLNNIMINSDEIVELARRWHSYRPYKTKKMDNDNDENKNYAFLEKSSYFLQSYKCLKQNNEEYIYEFYDPENETVHYSISIPFNPNKKIYKSVYDFKTEKLIDVYPPWFLELFEFEYV